MKLIFLLVTILSAQWSFAAPDRHKCQNEINGYLKMYKVKSVDTDKNGIKTTRYVHKEATNLKSRGNVYTVEVIEDGTKVVVKKHREEKIYGYKADTVTDEAVSFEDLQFSSDNQCVKRSYSEKQAARVGGEIKPFTDIQLNPDNCAVLRNALMGDCSKELSVPTTVVSAFGEPIKSRETAMSIFSECAQQGLDNTPAKYQEAIFRLLPTSAIERERASPGSGKSGLTTE